MCPGLGQQDLDAMSWQPTEPIWLIGHKKSHQAWFSQLSFSTQTQPDLTPMR
jgi:hypothetical protein